MTRMRLGQIKAPHFTAGFETDGRVRNAAPIIKYMIGWTDDELRRYVARKGWKAVRVKTVLDAAEADPLVQSVLSVFPRAEIVDVRNEEDTALGEGFEVSELT